ncbi:hyaluronidase, partial [Streptomyces cirratus]
GRARAGGPRRAGREALAALAGNTASSGLKQEESAYLRPLVEEFWRARAAGDRRPVSGCARPSRCCGRPGAAAGAVGGGRPVAGAALALRRRGQLAVDVLAAQARGDGAAAWQASRELARARRGLAEPGGARVDTAVLEPFLAKAAAESDSWTGASRPAGTVSREPGAWTVRWRRSGPCRR